MELCGDEHLPMLVVQEDGWVGGVAISFAAYHDGNSVCV